MIKKIVENNISDLKCPFCDKEEEEIRKRAHIIYDYGSKQIKFWLIPRSLEIKLFGLCDFNRFEESHLKGKDILITRVGKKYEVELVSSNGFIRRVQIFLRGLFIKRKMKN